MSPGPSVGSAGGRAVRPPLLLRALLLASLAMCVLTLGYAAHYTRGWYEVRRPRDPGWSQRLTLHGVPWFKPAFVQFLHRLQRTIPAGSRVLIEPSRGEDVSISGKARWFLFLNYYCDDLELYVRRPSWASGTLVDYPRWLQHHYVTLNRPEAFDLRMRELLEMEDRDIDWKIRIPVTEGFQIDEVEIYRREGAEWIRVPLASGVRRDRRGEPAPDGERDGAPGDAGDVGYGAGEAEEPR